MIFQKGIPLTIDLSPLSEASPKLRAVFGPLDGKGEITVTILDEDGKVLCVQSGNLKGFDWALAPGPDMYTIGGVKIFYADHRTALLEIRAGGETFGFTADLYSLVQWKRVEVGLAVENRAQFEQWMRKSEEGQLKMDLNRRMEVERMVELGEIPRPAWL